MVAQHEDEQVVGVDSEAREHAADFGVEGGQGFEDEGVGRLGRFLEGGHAVV